MTLSLGEALNTASVSFLTIKMEMMISHRFLDELQCMVRRQSTKGSLRQYCTGLFMEISYHFHKVYK